MHYFILIISLAFISCEYLQSDTLASGPTQVPFFQVVKETTINDKLKAEYTKWIGVQEATKNNDGKEVEMFQASRGLFRVAWCNLLKIYVFEAVGIQVPHLDGRAASSHNPNKAVFIQNRFSGEPLPGMSCTFWGGGRINHAGFFDERISENSYYSVEGNYSDAVTRVVRSFGATYSICVNY